MTKPTAVSCDLLLVDTDPARRNRSLFTICVKLVLNTATSQVLRSVTGFSSLSLPSGFSRDIMTVRFRVSRQS
jgi:hypothetical protein